VQIVTNVIGLPISARVIDEGRRLKTILIWPLYSPWICETEEGKEIYKQAYKDFSLIADDLEKFIPG